MFLTSDNKLKTKWLEYGAGITGLIIVLGMLWFDKPLYVLMRKLDCGAWRIFDYIFDAKIWLALTGMLMLFVWLKKALNNMSMFKKVLLYPLPVAILCAIIGTSGIWYFFDLSVANMLLCFLMYLTVLIILLGIPIFLALNSNSKHKTAIITLDIVGMLIGVLYIVSLVWGIIEYSKSGKRKFNIPSIRTNYAFLIFSSVLSAGIVAKIIKICVGRFRPIFFEALDITGFRPFSLEWAFNSMPSGHTTATFAGLIMAGMLAPKIKPITWTLAIIVGVSRVAIGAHWPTDVILGAFIGMVAADVVKYLAFKRK